jgi:hypothetical protein
LEIKLEVVSDELAARLFKVEIREKSRLILKGRFLLHFHAALCIHKAFKVKNLNVWKLSKKRESW